ncbi:MAG: glycosyltransferase family 87 protein, partial [Solirubrobacteraceae bacterium]
MAISKGNLCARWAARLVFITAAAMFVSAATSHVALPPLHPVHEYGFFDLKVYRHAAGVVNGGQPLYSVKLRRGLGFTYPPFAVLLFLPLTLISLAQSELAMTLVNVVLVAVAVHAALALGRRVVDAGRSNAGGHRRHGRRRRRRSEATRSVVSWLATAGSAWGWLAAAAALWFEPVTSAIGYGQIDLLIAALAIADLAYGKRTRARGVGIGLAAALKLTPLVFIPYLALTGRGRIAARALVAFGLSIVVALIVMPSDSLKYWGGKFLDLSRVAGHGHLSGAGVADQSLRGGLLRLLPGI